MAPLQRALFALTHPALGSIVATHEIAAKATTRGTAFAMVRIRAPKDFYAGLLFIGIGTLGAVMALNYPLGSATRMGPGYLPTILSCGTALLGLVVLLSSFAIDGPPATRIGWRPLILITGAIVVFALTVNRIGFVGAVVLTAIIGGFAAREMGKLELALLAIGLATFSALVFVYGLGQPVALWPW